MVSVEKLYKLYINGQFVEGTEGPLDVFNPATGERITTMRCAGVEQAQEALEAAQEAFKTWSYTSLTERGKWMYKLRDACAARKDELVDLLARESGKSYAVCSSELDRFYDYFGYYAEEALRVNDVGIQDYNSHRDRFYRVMMRPLGVIVAHLPWNAPVLFIAAKLCPALASGCTIVIKPSSSTPLTACRIAEIAAEIGMPAGVFNVVVGKASVVGNYLSASKIPAMVTVIGSTATGLEVMNQMASSIKKTSLELGGNAPCIVMPDADPDTVSSYIINNKTHNSGQACANVNRIFVHEDIHDAFVEMLVEKLKKVKVGWGKDTPTALSSLIDISNRDRVLGLVEDSVAHGAKLLYGGCIPEDLPEHLKKGAFMVPAVLDGVTDDMKVANVEIFGPIYSILTFHDLDEVLERANNTDAGLGSYIFTHDNRTIIKAAEALDFGKVYVNGAPTWTPNMPHIGIKQSGVGCMFGEWSLREYYRMKLLSVAP